jgi:hypothetical protein
MIKTTFLGRRVSSGFTRFFSNAMLYFPAAIASLWSPGTIAEAAMDLMNSLLSLFIAFFAFSPNAPARHSGTDYTITSSPRSISGILCATQSNDENH